jgi:hypothetical protein
MLFATPNDRLRADSYVLGRTEVELVKFARCSNSGVGEVKKGRGLHFQLFARSRSKQRGNRAGVGHGFQLAHGDGVMEMAGKNGEEHREQDLHRGSGSGGMGRRTTENPQRTPANCDDREAAIQRRDSHSCH